MKETDTVDYYLKCKTSLNDRKISEIEKQQKWKQDHYSCCHNLKSGPHSRICVNADGELRFKNRFVQSYPAFFTVDDEDYFVLNFNTQDELLGSEYVSRWNKEMDGRKFYRYSLTRSNYHNSLMAEYDLGKYWICIGHLKSDVGITLPTWESRV